MCRQYSMQNQSCQHEALWKVEAVTESQALLLSVTEAPHRPVVMFQSYTALGSRAWRVTSNTLTSDASLVSCLALAYDAKGLIHILKLIYGDPVCTAFKHAVKLIFKCNSSPKEIKHANGILI